MNNYITCPKCGTKAKSFFCPNCGEIFVFPSFIGNNDERKRNLQKFINNVVSVGKQQKIDVSSAIDNSPIKNAIYRKYYEKIAYLQKLCSNKTTQSYFLNSGVNLFEKINAFAEKCEIGECQIAVIGTVKAGKSMFINSLIGNEIASSYPTPETASLTKFRKSENGDYIKVTFYNSKEWQELWESVHSSTSEAIKEDESEDFISLYKSLNAEKIRTLYLNKQNVTYFPKSLEDLKALIDKFTSARFPEHFFAKEVEVGLNDFFAPSNVVIVDTPGLDDPVPYRTDITRKYLNKANVVLLCIRSNRPEISATELKQLSYIFAQLRYNKDRIITFGTQIDEQRDMLKFWNKHTLPEYLKYLSRSSLYGSKEMAEKHLFPITSYYYLLFKKVIENPKILVGKENKKIRDDLSEAIRRCYDVPEFQDLVDELGQEEAMKVYKSPKQVFDEHQKEILQMTQVSQIREMILNGPIRNANDIILKDIKDQYVLLNKEIHKISKEIAIFRQETIDTSKAGDITDQIARLEKHIAEEKRLQRDQSELLSRLLSEMQEKSQKSLNKIKS